MPVTLYLAICNLTNRIFSGNESIYWLHGGKCPTKDPKEYVYPSLFTQRPLPKVDEGKRCSEPDCERQKVAFGLCSTHYKRMRRAA